MKKLTALILAAVLVLSLAACGTANNAATDTRSTNAPASAAPDASAAPSGKVLVVYYSASGNTERVAKDIAGAAGADLFEIWPTASWARRRMSGSEWLCSRCLFCTMHLTESG